MSLLNTQLLDILESIEGNGTFVSSGVSSITLPGLHIEGLGELGLPLQAEQVKAMIALAKKAPFGKGSETILDSSVRSAWEINGDQVSFLNKKWTTKFNKIVEEIKKGLGIESYKITCPLYKLLIYEEGDFFLPHKDSEKEKGMFGTLIIGLPSTHTGGELCIRFNGDEETVDFSVAASDYMIPYIAFYADCEHEIKPVTSGYRVCLVYNMIHTSGSNQSPISVFSDQIEEMSSLLSGLDSADRTFPQAILLGHEYTPENFSLSALKHHDRPRAEALFLAARKAGYFAKLGLLTRYEMGALEAEYDYNWEYKEDGDVEMGEIYETSTSITHWGEDRMPTLGEINIADEAILSQKTIGEGEPTETEEEWFTGNAGMTLEYWYHYGAIVLWPIQMHTAILSGKALAIRIPWISYYLRHWEDSKLDSPRLAKALVQEFAALDFGEKEDRLSDPFAKQIDVSPVIDCIIKLEDETFVREIGQEGLVRLFHLIQIESWIGLLHAYDPMSFAPVFESIGKSGNGDQFLHLLTLLEGIEPDAVLADSSFFRNQVDQIPSYLAYTDLHKLASSPYAYRETGKRKEVISQIVFKVLTMSQWKQEDENWNTEAQKSLTRKMPRAYVNDVLGLILQTHPNQNGHLFDLLLDASIQDLSTRVNNKPQAPTNWSRALPQTNNGTWEMLKDFLLSPVQQVFEYKANKEYRVEVERHISNVTIDLKTQTVRRGSPHTLRITKNQAAYERALKAWEKDVKHLKALKKVKTSH